MLYLAHASHWLAQVAYVAPVLVLLVMLGITSLRDRRRERPGEGPPANGPPASSAEPPPA
jgi:cytochrome c-type biogenesis protein CcmH/NrfF